MVILKDFPSNKCIVWVGVMLGSKLPLFLLVGMVINLIVRVCIPIVKDSP